MRTKHIPKTPDKWQWGCFPVEQHGGHIEVPQNWCKSCKKKRKKGPGRAVTSQDGWCYRVLSLWRCISGIKQRWNLCCHQTLQGFTASPLVSSNRQRHPVSLLLSHFTLIISPPPLHVSNFASSFCSHSSSFNLPFVLIVTAFFRTGTFKFGQWSYWNKREILVKMMHNCGFACRCLVTS